MKNLVKLRAWRDSAGLTQQELADMTGLTRRRVSDFETGQRNLKRDSLEDYATALGVDLELIAEIWAEKHLDDMGFEVKKIKVSLKG